MPDPERPDAPPAVDLQAQLRPDDAPAARGGLAAEYPRAGKLCEAIEKMPADKDWDFREAMRLITIALQQELKIGIKLKAMDRPDMWGTEDGTKMWTAMEVALSQFEDGTVPAEHLETLRKNREELTRVKAQMMMANAKLEETSFDRGDLMRRENRMAMMAERGDTREPNADEKEAMVMVIVDEEDGTEYEIPLMDDGQGNVHMAVAKDKDGRDGIIRDKVTALAWKDELREEQRALQQDPKVLEASNYFRLIGITPEKAEQLLKDRQSEVEATRTAIEGETSKLLESRREVMYWGQLQTVGLGTFIEYYSEIIKGISDLDTAADLLTRVWNEKPPSDMFEAMVASEDMNIAVSTTFRTLMAMDIVKTKPRTLMGQATTDGKQVTVVEQIADYSEEQKAHFRKYGLWDEKAERPTSPFSTNLKSQEVRKFMKGMQRLIRDELKKKGVKDARVIADQSLPTALAMYEVLLLGSRSSVRRDENGVTLKVAMRRKDDNAVVVDTGGDVVYVDEEAGPATMTGWPNDLEQKAMRTRSRVISELIQGNSAPTPFVVLGIHESMLRPRMEAWKVKVGDGEMSMLEAIRTGQRSIKECFAEMNQNARFLEALAIFRAVGAFNGLNPPLADIRVISREADADPKSLAEVKKYFNSMEKALRLIFRDNPEKRNMMLVNDLAQIMRYARETDPRKGGNAQNSLARPSTGPGEQTTRWLQGDERFEPFRTILCLETNILPMDLFEMAKSLASSSDVSVLVPEDLEEPIIKTRLSVDQGVNAKSPAMELALKGPYGDMKKPGTEARRKALAKL